jgi:hypothetical protein
MFSLLFNGKVLPAPLAPTGKRWRSPDKKTAVAKSASA